jgi:hypothetical protein
MRWIILLYVSLALFSSCVPYYTAVVISKGNNMGEYEMETKTNDGWYIRPDLTDSQWDTINWHDTIRIKKGTLKLWEKK